MISWSFLFFFGCGSVAGHAPVGAGRKRDGSDLRSVGNATALELLRKETPYEDGERLVDFFVSMFACESVFREEAELFGSGAVFRKMVQEEVVNFVGTENAFGFLRNLAA